MWVGICACKGNIGQRLILAQKKNYPTHYRTPFATLLADTVFGTGVFPFTGYTFKQELPRNTSILVPVCVTVCTLQVSSRFVQMTSVEFQYRDENAVFDSASNESNITVAFSIIPTLYHTNDI